MSPIPRVPTRAWLLGIFLVALGVSAIGLEHPRDFIFEHILTVALLVFLIAADRRRPISNATSILLFLFLLLHVLGAHYTYSLVPYDDWARSLFGQTVSETFGWERNHYDRLVHLAFGILMVRPMQEMVERTMRLDATRSLIVAVAFVAVLSKLYELLEWIYAISMRPEHAALYNGEQGDAHDAQKDMGLALVGSLVAAGALVVIERMRAAKVM